MRQAVKSKLSERHSKMVWIDKQTMCQFSSYTTISTYCKILPRACIFASFCHSDELLSGISDTKITNKELGSCNLFGNRKPTCRFTATALITHLEAKISLREQMVFLFIATYHRQHNLSYTKGKQTNGKELTWSQVKFVCPCFVLITRSSYPPIVCFPWQELCHR